MNKKQSAINLKSVLLILYLILFLILNGYFLSELPLFSDDIYNLSESNHILSNFFQNLQNNSHYARFPLFSFLNLYLLDFFQMTPGALHLLPYFLNIVTSIVIVKNVTRATLDNQILSILFLLSIPTSASNLLWFTSAHTTFALFLSTLSACYFKNYSKSRKRRHLILSLIFQYLSINTIEIANLFVFIHLIFLIEAENKTIPLRLKSMIRILLPFLVLSLAHKLISNFIWNLPLNKNYYSFSLDHALKFLPDISYWFYSYFIPNPSSYTKHGITLLLLLFTFILFFMNKNKKLLSVAFILFFSFALQVPYAGITSYNYMYPRFSFPFGIFITLGIVKLLLYGIKTKFSIFYKFLFITIVIFFNYSWLDKIIFKTTEINNYITGFYETLGSNRNNIEDNTVIIALIFRPPQKITYIFDNSEYLEWAHASIGFMVNSGLNKRNIHLLTINNEEDLKDNKILLNLRGYYGIKYGTGCDGLNNMTMSMNIKNILLLKYERNKLEPITEIILDCKTKASALNMPWLAGS